MLKLRSLFKKCPKLYFVSCKSLKAKLLQEGIFFLIHVFSRDVLVMKKLEIKKIKPAFIISVLKIKRSCSLNRYYRVAAVFFAATLWLGISGNLLLEA